MKKPHIIIFNPDEMRWDTMAHMGNPAAYTPNLDDFVRRDAVSFSHAYCQNTVCVPSRCSFTTGLYPHVKGHRTMRYLLHEDETSVFQELKQNGYHVWMNARNDLVAGQIPGLIERHADEIYYHDPEERKVKAGSGMKNKYPYSHFEGILAEDENNDIADVSAAIERILHPNNDKPLCIFLGLNNPHPPYAVERRYYERIDRQSIPPRIRGEDTAGKAKMLGEIRKWLNMDEYTEEEWQELRTVYLAQCSKIDDLFGMLCNALKEGGIYDDCAIFFLSDHGDFAGDYSLVEKAQNTFEDCLTRVPLIIKPPGGQKADPGVTDSIAELIDFYATVMDYAQVEPTHDHFGRSLRPVIENRERLVRKYAFCEGGRMGWEIQCDEYHSEGPCGASPKIAYWPKMKAQSDPVAHEKGTMICDGKYKYVERISGNHELYNLQLDPHETVNIYKENRNSQLVLEMRLELLKWYQQTCDIVPREYDQRFSWEKFWTMIKKICPKEKEEEVRMFIENGGSALEVIELLTSGNKTGEH